MVYDRLDKPLGDIAEADVFSLVRRATINGEHALEVTTTRKLGKGQRILMQDGRQIWHEYVVDGVDELHGAGRRPVGTYTCVWSIQHDLQGVRVSVMPGVQSPVTAGEALARLLGTTRRWTVGTVTNTSTGGASMYDTDAWSALSTLVKTWGGEVDTTIEVDQAGVVARKVDLYAQQGDQEAKRRYDFGADIKSVRRTMPDGPLFCRMTPRGKGEETEGGGYGRKVTIESVNDGKDYLELASMVPLAKLPDGTGGWEYPTLEVENGDCETPAELLAWARDVLEDTLTPQVGYDVDVLQAAREGIDMHGVSLGDAVQVVDRSFGDDGLRVSARVVEMTVDELEDRDVNVKLGHIAQGVTSSLGSLAASISKVRDAVIDINGGTLSTAGYIDSLISRLNSQISADGGYTYIVPGQGIRTYDQAVSDPLIGAEATKVVEIKGGSIRIANTKTAQGEWMWRTFGTGDGFTADLINAGTIDAAVVNIINLLQIGDDENNVRIAGSSINITAGGRDGALQMTGLPYTWDRQVLSEKSGGRIRFETANPSIPSYEQGCRRRLFFDKGNLRLVPYDVDGTREYRYQWRISISGVRNGVSYQHSEEGETVCPMTHPLRFAKIFDIDDGSCTITIYYPQPGVNHEGTTGPHADVYCSWGKTPGVHTADKYYLLYVSVALQVAGSTGEIRTGTDDVYLHTGNFTDLMTDGLAYSGQISIPFVYNNTMRNYRLKFVGGVLSTFDIITPTDDSFYI